MFACLLVAVVCVVGIVGAKDEQPVLPSTCQWPVNGPDGDLWLICLPDNWEGGNLAVFFHGFVPTTNPSPYMPWDQFNSDGTYLWDTVMSLGWGFAASSYSQNGFCPDLATQDSLEMISYVRQTYPPIKRVYGIGMSMGSTAVAMIATEHPDVLAGEIVSCASIGNFEAFVNHVYDSRVVFDYFFPGVLPGNATYVPETLYNDWGLENSVYKAAITAAVNADEMAAKEFLRVTNTPAAPGDFPWFDYPTSVINAVHLSVEVTTSLQQTSGCIPYDNTATHYHGAWNDYKLNKNIQRYSWVGDRSCIEKYEVGAELEAPMIFMANIGDPYVPISQLWMYREKVITTWDIGNMMLFTGVPVLRYGHCQFNSLEVMFSFGLMYLESLLLPVPPGLDETLSKLLEFEPQVDAAAFLRLNSPLPKAPF